MVTLQPPHPCSVFFHPIWCPLSLLDRPPKSVSSTLSVPSLLTKVNPIKNLLFRLQLIPSWTSNVQGCTQSNIFPLEPVLLMDMADLFNTHHQCVEMIRFKLSLGNLFVFSESWPSFILLRVARTVGSHLALALPGTFTPSVTWILWLGKHKCSSFQILNFWRKIWPQIKWIILITGAEQIFLAYSSLQSYVWLETSWYYYKHSKFSNYNCLIENVILIF